MLLGLAICLASGVKAQFYDSADDIYYYVELDKNGQVKENGRVIVINFDGNKACDLSGLLQYRIEVGHIIKSGCYVDDVKRNIQTSITYYEDKVETTDYKLRYVSGNKYQGETNNLSWTNDFTGNYCWLKETHTFDFTSDRNTMTDNIEQKTHQGTIYDTVRFVKVEKSFFKVGRSRTPSGTLHE